MTRRRRTPEPIPRTALDLTEEGSRALLDPKTEPQPELQRLVDAVKKRRADADRDR